MRDGYVTVSGPSDRETNIKGSRFIACIRRCGSEDELCDIINDVKSSYPNATHYCYAALFDGNERFSDNGEPSGTAGRPIAQVLHGSGLDDVALVVVRYFGGTLLGTGGLVQAYSGISAEAVHSADRLEAVLCTTVRFRLQYPEYNRFLSECPRFIVGRPGQTFSDSVELTADVPKLDVEDFERSVIDISKGNVRFEHLGNRYAYRP